MAANTINTRIQHKREFEINWLSSSFVPLPGELIIYLKEVDQTTGEILTTKKNSTNTPVVPCNGRTTPYLYDRVKIGDGKTSVNDLNFFSDPGISAGTIDPAENTTGQFYFKYSTE
jgi:hypothetical protein